MACSGSLLSCLLIGFANSLGSKQKTLFRYGKMENSMKLIGLTGGIASGKSFVAKILEKCGAVIVDADLLAREVVAPGEPAFREIVDAFGDMVLGPAGTLDRTVLGKLVFADAAARKVLEQITHPRIAERAAGKIEDARQRGVKVLFYMVPLLIEAGLASTVDEVWLVSVDSEVQINRLMRRDAISRDDAVRKIAAQMPIYEKTAYADVIIDNNGLPDETASSITREWQRLLARIAVSDA